MVKPHPDLRVILIGGSSHAGKSTLSISLAAKLGWTHLSTDSLARHPGRTWKPEGQAVPDHVAEHYLTLSVDELIEDVLRHYKNNVWPLIETIVTTHATDSSTGRIIMEGSALWPESVATLDLDNIAALWLTAANDFFVKRIYDASHYQTKSPRNKKLVDKFLERTLVYNVRMMDAVRRLGLVSMLVDEVTTVDELAAKCLSVLNIES